MPIMIDQIKDLLKSGQKDNIELAQQLCVGQGLDFKKQLRALLLDLLLSGWDEIELAHKLFNNKELASYRLEACRYVSTRVHELFLEAKSKSNISTLEIIDRAILVIGALSKATLRQTQGHSCRASDYLRHSVLSKPVHDLRHTERSATKIMIKCGPGAECIIDYHYGKIGGQECQISTKVNLLKYNRWEYNEYLSAFDRWIAIATKVHDDKCKIVIFPSGMFRAKHLIIEHLKVSVDGREFQFATSEDILRAMGTYAIPVFIKTIS